MQGSHMRVRLLNMFVWLQITYSMTILIMNKFVIIVIFLYYKFAWIISIPFLHNQERAKGNYKLQEKKSINTRIFTIKDGIMKIRDHVWWSRNESLIVWISSFNLWPYWVQISCHVCCKSFFLSLQRFVQL